MIPCRVQFETRGLHGAGSTQTISGAAPSPRQQSTASAAQRQAADPGATVFTGKDVVDTKPCNTAGVKGERDEAAAPHTGSARSRGPTRPRPPVSGRVPQSVRHTQERNGGAAEKRGGRRSAAPWVARLGARTPSPSGHRAPPAGGCLRRGTVSARVGGFGSVGGPPARTPARTQGRQTWKLL